MYVDVKNNIALGIDAVSVSKHSVNGNEIRLDIKSLLAGLRVPYAQAFRVDLHVTGLEDKDYNLILNGAPAITLKSSELSKLAILIYPDNKIVVENKKT